MTKEQPKKTKEGDLKAQIEDLTHSLKQVQADFENYKKRVERDRQDTIKYAGESLIKQFLPILDNLELALKHCKQKDDFYQGIEMIYANMHTMLEEAGVKPIEAIGLPFDPYRHEALLSIDSKEPKNTILEEMQKGYTYNEKIIRPAKVTISKGNNGGNKNE